MHLDQGFSRWRSQFDINFYVLYINQFEWLSWQLDQIALIYWKLSQDVLPHNLRLSACRAGLFPSPYLGDIC